MKKLTIAIYLLLFASAAFSQTTYYWVGGAGPTSYTANNTWNTQLNGGGASRSVAGAQVTDILIFDGTNIGGATPATGQVTATTSSQTCRQLKLQNGAGVMLNRTSAGSAAITINGDGTAADDLTIDAGCTLTLGGPSFNFDVNIVLGASATSLISGTVYLSPLSATVHTRSYITAPTAGSLVFASGSACYITDSTATSGFNGATQGSVLFKNGSSLYYYSGRSPIGNNSTTQFANFETGSNCYFRGSSVSYIDNVTPYVSSNWMAQKAFGNVYIQNGATIVAEGPVYKIDNFTIDNGCTFTGHTSGHTPVLGNLTVNGTLNAGAGTNALVLGGNSAQTVTGTGSINVPLLAIANYSDVTLAKSVTVSSSCNVNGKLDLGTSQITGAGTFSSRVTSVATGVSGNTTAGSYLITNVVGTISGVTGLAITGTGVDVNTNVTGFSSANATISLSKPAASTATGAAFTFGSDTATLATANPNGMDTLTGSVVVTGTKSFQSGTNYIINAATTAPLGISSGSPASMTAGSLVLNAPVTTNYNSKVTISLTLNNGNLTIRPQDTVRILSGNDIGGAPFSSSKYIVSSLSGNNAGVLRIDNFNSMKLFPVGSSGNYLPAWLSPAASTMDFAVSVFEGVTLDATPTGTPFTPEKKKTVVDAVWTINRINGSGDCVLQTNWPASLEGSTFSGYGGANIGIGRYNGSDWDIVIGNGNNGTNTAAALYSNFSAFGVGEAGSPLPVKFETITAALKTTGTLINWTVANEDARYTYTVEKRTGSNSFTEIGKVTGTNKSAYSFTDISPAGNENYYRIKAIDPFGKTTYSNTVLVKATDLVSINMYPNPVVSTLNVSGIKQAAELYITDHNGKRVKAIKVIAGTAAIDVRMLAAGSYVLAVYVDGELVGRGGFVKE